MSAFTQLPALGAELPEYRGFFGEDREGMGRLVAGFVTDPVFRVSGLAQLVLAPLALLLAGLEWRPLRLAGGVAQAVRVTAIGLGLALVLVHAIGMEPRMNATLTAYRTAALEGRSEAAVTSYKAFDVDHRIAQRLFELRLVLVLVAVGASAAAVRPVPFAATGERDRS